MVQIRLRPPREVPMSLLSKAIVFGLKEVAKPTLSKIGEHIGNAVGNVIGKKIDPDHDSSSEEDGEDSDEEKEAK